jgi:uncharacterized protein
VLADGSGDLPGETNVKIDLDAGAHDARRISAYRSGEITIGGVAYRTSILVGSDGGIEPWPPRAFGDLAETHFETIAIREPEIVLLGTGARVLFPAAALLAPCFRRGIGVEVMDTGAACRSFNFLLGEGRRVIAALLPPP